MKLIFILYFLGFFLLEVSSTHVGSHYCHLQNATVNNRKYKPTSIVCNKAPSISVIYDEISGILEKKNSKEIELIVANSTLKTAKFSKLRKFNHLTLQSCYLTIPVMRWISSLNLTTLTIEKCSNRQVNDHRGNEIDAFAIDLRPLVKGLKKFEVTGCNITVLNVKGIKDKLSHISFNFTDNSFECGRDFSWLYNMHKNTSKKYISIHLENNFCFMERMEGNITFEALYTLRNKPFLVVMEYKNEVAVNCPIGCTCEFIGMMTVFRPVIAVDCIGLNMKRLPFIVPKGSSRFNFTQNMIEDISPMYSNPLYAKVSFMDLSHNRISHLDDLMFAEVLKQQRRGVGFNLNHNCLKKFPAKVMLKLFKEFKYMPQFNLGYNPYQCTCDYIGDYQQLIFHYLYDIKDYRDIRCSPDDPYNPGKAILSLDTQELCHREPVFHSLDIVNMVLALILLILVSDFIYNYRQYREHRKLPWIVTKFNKR